MAILLLPVVAILMIVGFILIISFNYTLNNFRNELRAFELTSKSKPDKNNYQNTRRPIDTAPILLKIILRFGDYDTSQSFLQKVLNINDLQYLKDIDRYHVFTKLIRKVSTIIRLWIISLIMFLVIVLFGELTPI